MELPDRPIKDPYQELPVKDYSYVNTQKKPSNKKGHSWVYIIFGLIILVLLGAGAFAYGHYTKDKTIKKNTTLAQKQVTTPKSTNSSTSQSPSIPLTSYSSSIFNLTLNYPTSWSVAANGNTSLTITSPETEMVADSGSSVEGKTVLTIVNQGQIPAAFGSTSEAVLNSQDISYTNPTSNQAAQTYLSFVQYPATTVIGGLDGIYVTGNNGYLKDQSIPSSDVSKVSPLIYFSFEQCPNQTCASPTALTISSTMWSNSTFSTPILDILKSISFN